MPCSTRPREPTGSRSTTAAGWAWACPCTPAWSWSPTAHRTPRSGSPACSERIPGWASCGTRTRVTPGPSPWRASTPSPFRCPRGRATPLRARPARGDLLDARPHLTEVELREGTVLGDHLAADHDPGDRRRLHRVHDLALQSGARQKRQVVELEAHEIGVAAGVDGADGKPEEVPPARGAEREGGGGAERASVREAGLGHEGCRAHLLEDALAVVGAAPIRSQPHPHAALEHLRDRRDSVPEEGVGAGAVHDSGAVLREELDLLGIHPDGVDDHEPFVEKAFARQEAHGRGPEAVEDPLALVACFGKVEVAGNPQVAGDLERRRDRRGRGR